MAPNDRPPVDLANLRSFSEGNPSEERHFVDLFIRQNDEALETLRACCVEGKIPEWVAATHLIKGGAACIGAARLSALAAQAQHQATMGAKDRRTFLTALEKETERVKVFFISEDLFSGDGKQTNS